MRRKNGWKGDMESVQKPAPGDLRFVHAFVNTADHRMGTERLTSPQALGEWLASQGLPDGGEITEAGLGRMIAVREGLRALLWVNNGAALSVRAVERLEKAATPQFRMHFASDGGIRLQSVSEGIDAALGRLLEIVHAAQIRGDWRHLKACANAACRGAFYDFTRNHSGVWCSSRRCGNQINARLYRQDNKRGRRMEAVSWTEDDGDLLALVFPSRRPDMSDD